MNPHRQSVFSILWGLLAGMVLAIPVTYGLVRWQSENRGVEVNQWRVSFDTGNFGNNYLLRAAIAVYSLGNAIPQEALFFHAFKDGSGTTLSGKQRYRISFPDGQYPPVGAFWSFTAYDAKDSFLVKNPLARYSISDRTPGVVTGPDGSLTFYFQNKAPVGMESNWLPVPEGEFTITLRTYIPQKELLNLEWKVPPIERIE